MTCDDIEPTLDADKCPPAADMIQIPIVWNTQPAPDGSFVETASIDGVGIVFIARLIPVGPSPFTPRAPRGWTVKSQDSNESPVVLSEVRARQIAQQRFDGYMRRLVAALDRARYPEKVKVETP